MQRISGQNVGGLDRLAEGFIYQPATYVECIFFI